MIDYKKTGLQALEIDAENKEFDAVTVGDLFKYQEALIKYRICLKIKLSLDKDDISF